MNERAMDAQDHALSSEEKLTVAVQNRNQKLDEYIDKQCTVEVIASNIRELIEPSGKGIERVLSTMSDIESRLELMDGLFLELGCIPEHGGDFDTRYYQWMRLERKIANRKITEIEEIPEEFHDDFRHLFDSSYEDQRPRDTEAIRDDLKYDIEELGYMLERFDDFSNYVPLERKKSSPQLNALREELNELWDEFKDGAKAVAYHF
jgi:archaellum component FlaC